MDERIAKLKKENPVEYIKLGMHMQANVNGWYDSVEDIHLWISRIETMEDVVGIFKYVINQFDTMTLDTLVEITDNDVVEYEDEALSWLD